MEGNVVPYNSKQPEGRLVLTSETGEEHAYHW